MKTGFGAFATWVSRWLFDYNPLWQKLLLWSALFNEIMLEIIFGKSWFDHALRACIRRRRRRALSTAAATRSCRARAAAHGRRPFNCPLSPRSRRAISTIRVRRRVSRQASDASVRK